jgi:hypothetical protein
MLTRKNLMKHFFTYAFLSFFLLLTFAHPSSVRASTPQDRDHSLAEANFSAVTIPTGMNQNMGGCSLVKGTQGASETLASVIFVLALTGLLFMRKRATFVS